MRITSIEIKNFRAFKGRPLKIDLHKTGKNLLVYGENGSGKSSLFYALRDFLECAAKRNDITQFPFRNIFINTNDGYIKIHFTDPAATHRNPNPQAKLYEWSASKNETSEQLILEINKTKGFIDYKSLPATYFLQQENSTVNIFNLLLTSILSHAENDLSRRPFGEEWQEINDSLANLNYRSRTQKEALIERIRTFNDGLRNKLDELKGKAQEILNSFGYALEIELNFGGVEYNAEEKRIDKQIVGLKVKFFRETREDHHQFLNEAKLSAIAISIFFAALLLQPISRLRIIALDDVLIGLDMSNRLPVLDILDSHFKDYQIFFFTYDKAWYDIVKNHIQSQKADGDWECVEFFAARTDERDVPVYAPDRKFLERAKEHLNDNDFKAAAVYARTHFEAKLKKFCEKKGLKIRYKEKASDLKSEDFWLAVKEGRTAHSWTQLTDQLLIEVQRYRKVILNPLSHADWSNVHRREVEKAIEVIEQLEAALDSIS
ncbi:MAG: AAA family ATPase [Acidobacteriota bacterium]